MQHTGSDLSTAINKAVAAHKQGNLSSAESQYGRLLDILPDNPDLLHLLGLVYHQQGRLDRACSCLDRAAQLQGTSSLFYYDLGSAQFHSGQLTAALHSLERACTLQGFPEAHFLSGEIYRRLGRLPDALRQYQRAISLKPDFPQALNNLGAACMQLGAFQKAADAFGKVVALMPERSDSLHNLGLALIQAKRHDEAIACFRKLIQLAPDTPSGFVNLGKELMLQGFLQEAQQHFRKAISLDDTTTAAHDNLLISMGYDPEVTPTGLSQLHTRWGTRHNSKQTYVHDSHDFAPEKKLKLGFVSPDFYHHPVALFLLPVLTNLDKAQTTAIAYSDTSPTDEVTSALRAHLDEWHEVGSDSHESLAERMYRDKIDILFDLTGHLAGNRLETIAYRPAPLQMSWIGYPHDTGLTAIDCRVTDPVCDPPGTPEQNIVRLPQTFCCFSPPPGAPDPGPVPSQRNRVITFGSFHNIARLNDRVLALWARVLQELPESRLLIYRTSLTGSAQKRIRASLSGHDIGSSRVVFQNRLSGGSYLPAYNEVDICLDTFPWSGHTTACESLWMGVPVITLQGERSAGRMVASVLTNLDLPECIARTEDDFVHQAIDLAGNRSLLRRLRSSLRERMKHSPVCDGPRFALSFQKMLRERWEKTCHVHTERTTP